MYNLSDIDTIRALLRESGFTFSKSLGQNFLIDGEVCPEMAKEAVSDGETGVLEIGAGIGVLTAEIAKTAEKVVSLEVDKRLLPLLKKTLADFQNVEIVNEDILKVDLHSLLKEKFGGGKISVCANLPYYITSPVIMRLLGEELPIESIVVMVQKEAADRICAKVGTRDSGALTVAVNYYSEAEKLFFVPKESFLPSPKVDSTVIKLKMRKQPPVFPKDEKLFWQTVKAAFAQRRKTALNSLAAGTNTDKEIISKALENCGFPLDIRAEKFTMKDFEILSDEILKLRS